MDKLAQIASPSTFTCPECHGSLWQVTASGPKRYRCHTGHSLTERSLAALQGKLVEDAIWCATRALHEKEKLAREMAEQALADGHASAALAKMEEAAAAQQSGETLGMVTGTVPVGQDVPMQTR